MQQSWELHRLRFCAFPLRSQTVPFNCQSQPKKVSYAESFELQALCRVKILASYCKFRLHTS